MSAEPHSQSPTIRIVRPSSREKGDLLGPSRAAIEAAGFAVRYDDIETDPAWTYSAGSITARTEQLMLALTEPGTDIICAARGGYGASDLLSRLDWETLKQGRPRVVSGFSDMCALLTAFHFHLGWPALHAPMPATTLWGKATEPDIAETLDLWQRLARGDAAGFIGRRQVTPVPSRENGDAVITGPLFGGCFSVLGALIGTPWLPKDGLRGHIVFFEDTGESPARLLRLWNQWLDSGLLAQVRAVIFGCLRNLGGDVPDNPDFVYEELARRAPVPVFRSGDFGHCAPNFPLLYGAPARIADNGLEWKLVEDSGGLA